MPATTQAYTCANEACKKLIHAKRPHIIVQRLHIQQVNPLVAVPPGKADLSIDTDFTDVAVCDKSCLCALVPNPERPAPADSRLAR